MPARLAQFPPDGWQVVRREEGHFLQQRREDGSWIDIAGPYKQRGAALQRYRILEERRIRAMRKANPHDPRLPEHNLPWYEAAQADQPPSDASNS